MCSFEFTFLELLVIVGFEGLNLSQGVVVYSSELSGKIMLSNPVSY